MLTRVLFAIGLLLAPVASAWAADPEVVALGLTDHATSVAEIGKGDALPAPTRETGGVAYLVLDGAEPGDRVTVRLMNEGKSLMHNVATVEKGGEEVFLQAGKTGVPAGGWPEGSYTAKVEIVRGGDVVLEKSSEPVTFD
ncbi:hypothetical protein A7A08_02833 [Methyloligella halotolerans]|uniref:Uncharacterized protein n=1 Tax=Methyloligella halotolerans TaxID=1177755 RepID=A0A1E2RVA4_9HYPH|nr:hypothetical protein [Methyloligella halotolerans]ODA66186.1 hypothetical protein A7A08_02833 [Methyloligella halotolerans]